MKKLAARLFPKLIRAKDGKLCGITFRNWTMLIHPADKSFEYWRICECCKVNEALVFCETHTLYVCGTCLMWHGRRSVGGDFILGFACRLMSKSWARQMSKGPALVRNSRLSDIEYFPNSESIR